ncbi:MAG: beta-lactamase family protein [Saprospiraceae bacterium]|nr:beta-lactamase family protein [Saprospiraceae bacterium]
MKNILLIVMAGFLSCSPSLGQPNPTQVPELLQAYLETTQERLGFQGVCLVQKGGKLLYHKAFGKASIELDVEMVTDHQFRVASISKSFTAHLIGMAAEEGKVKVEGKLSSYLNEFAGKGWDEISIQHLLTHTSGIPHHKGMEDYWTVRSRLSLPKASILEAIRKMEIQFAPGEDFLYSSPAYFLLAAILEKVYDQPLSSLWREKVGQPLGLDNTGFYNNQTIVSGLTSGYHLLPGHQLIAAPYRDFSGLKGGGDMYSSTENLNRWNTYILQKLHAPGYIAEAVRPKNKFIAKRHAGAQYGFGWFIRAKEGEKPLAYFHGGGTFGCSAISAIYPEEDLSIIILSNVSGLPIDMIWQNVETISLGLPFELPKALPEWEVSEKSLESYIGNYASTTGGQRLRVFIHKEELYAQLQGRPPFPLSPTNKDEFYGEKVGISFSFQAGKGNQISGLKAEGRGRSFSFEKED